MKLIIAIVQPEELPEIKEELLKKKIYYKQNCLKTRDTLISKFSESSTYHLYDAFVDELG